MAAERDQIPHTTLASKVKGKHGKKAGCPSTFTMDEEGETTEILVRCSKMGVPLGTHTLIKLVKAIAIAKDKTETRHDRGEDRSSSQKETAGVSFENESQDASIAEKFNLEFLLYNTI
ncbi:hypothetical protein RvY_14116 [Ramazzottius varieornatus]|uniref:Uncharacterized protein n=1 Tax=Ramazzottius varieornatus TaxID=947166 RepID=A0A1D1VVB6_RAMVA|nr:hypothetical protein RvY_14116 [Ramazzottius varieornatus]